MCTHAAYYGYVRLCRLLVVVVTEVLKGCPVSSLDVAAVFSLKAEMFPFFLQSGKSFCYGAISKSLTA